MELALVTTIPTRPEVVEITGLHGGKRGTVSIKAHDRYYLAKKHWHKRRIFATHPDRGGHITYFRWALNMYKAFENRERKWYSALNLQPPRR